MRSCLDMRARSALSAAVMASHDGRARVMGSSCGCGVVESTVCMYRRHGFVGVVGGGGGVPSTCFRGGGGGGGGCTVN